MSGLHRAHSLRWMRLQDRPRHRRWLPTPGAMCDGARTPTGAHLEKGVAHARHAAEATSAESPPKRRVRNNSIVQSGSETHRSPYHIDNTTSSQSARTMWSMRQQQKHSGAPTGAQSHEEFGDSRSACLPARSGFLSLAECNLTRRSATQYTRSNFDKCALQCVGPRSGGSIPDLSAAALDSSPMPVTHALACPKLANRGSDDCTDRPEDRRHLRRMCVGLLLNIEAGRAEASSRSKKPPVKRAPP